VTPSIADVPTTTLDCGMKPVPAIVMLAPVAPAVRNAGVMPVTAGVGFRRPTWRSNRFELPPPGGGVTTMTCKSRDRRKSEA
jgi:hypothetical protein